MKRIYTFVTGSQTMAQYHTPDEALKAAIVVAEKGADAIYTPRGLGIVETLAKEGLCVQGHLGLVPGSRPACAGSASSARSPKKPWP